MGRSYLGPPDKGIRQVLFAGRERDGAQSPLCCHLALAGCRFPRCRPGLFHFIDIFFETTTDHHRWSLDLFKYGSGGGHAPKPNLKDHAQRTHHLCQEESTRVWPARPLKAESLWADAGYSNEATGDNDERDNDASPATC